MTAPDPLAQHMPAVARALLGDPNPKHSKPGKPRWGSNGSLAIDEGQGIWFDHENQKGGGVIDLIAREKQLSGNDAVEWLDSIGCQVNGNRKPKSNGAKHSAGKAERKLIESYDYLDVDGAFVLQVRRVGFLDNNTLRLNGGGKPEKTFQQRRPGPNDSKHWIWGIRAGEYMRKGPGVDWYPFDAERFERLPATRERKEFPAAKVVPYRAPELVEAIANGQAVFVVEGEQKADALARWNLSGTCNAQGSGKWTKEHAAYLRDADVVILPDNDDAGRKHAEQVAKSLVGIAKRIRILELPGLKPKGDIVDWQKVGHTREEFDALASKAADLKQQVPAPEKKSQTDPSAFESAPASTFEMKGITWLWQNRFALGKLGLIAGMPDMGKGLIWSDITARVTTGDVWPCNEGRALKGNVVVLSAEDDIEDTVVPRLVAAGADLNRVHIARMVRQGDGKRMFSLVSDLAMLRHKLETIGDVAMVVIDPMSAYLGVGKVDSYRTTDVRGVLAPLTELAAEKQVFLLGVLHFNKKSDVSNAVLRISDSLAFAATARHCYVVVEDAENERQRLFVKAKNNLAPDTKALTYGVNAIVVGQDPKTGQDIWAPRIVWGLEHREITATEAMQAAAAGTSRSAAKESAEEFLRDMLAHGPVSKRDIEDAAEANCISEITLRRAKSDLGIVAKKAGMKGGWTWQLPDEPARKGAEE